MEGIQQMKDFKNNNNIDCKKWWTEPPKYPQRQSEPTKGAELLTLFISAPPTNAPTPEGGLLCLIPFPHFFSPSRA